LISGVMTVLVVTLISPWFFANLAPASESDDDYPGAQEVAA